MNNFQCFLSLVLSLPSTVLAQQFVLPIGGTPYKDWTIVNYVDLDTGGDILDWKGGNYTYNGHNAIDFTLPNFAAMDAGVSVNAAQSGTVIAVHDGEFDRWSRANPNTIGAEPNSVKIDHGNGIVTEYLHFKKNSITVSIGDLVVQGQQIGLVGSSGRSSDAHLHFAVYDNSINIETYENPSFWWQDALEYSGDVPGVLDFGITNQNPSINDLVERPAEYSVYDLQEGSGQKVFIWANIHGINTVDLIEYSFLEPDGELFSGYSQFDVQIRYGWLVRQIAIPEDAKLGTWSVEARINGTLFLQDSFVVLNSIIPPPETGEPPTVPGNVTGNVYSRTAVEIFWTHSTGDRPIARYDVLRDGVLIGWTNGNSWFEEGLQPGTEYQYSLIAIDVDRTSSAASSPYTLRTRDNPSTETEVPAVTGLRAEVYGKNFAELFWDRPLGQSFLYRIFIGGAQIVETDGVSWWSRDFPATGSTEVSVVAVNNNGVKSEPKTVTVTTAGRPTGVVSPVSGLRADVYSRTAAEIFWYRKPGIGNRYLVFADGEEIVNTDGTSWYSESFSRGSTTVMSVVAVDADGNQSAPQSVTVTTRRE